MKKFITILICTLVLISCCVISVSAEDTLPYELPYEIEGVELLSTETTSNVAVGIYGIYCIVIYSISAIAAICFFVTLVHLADWDVSSILLAILICAMLILSIIGIAQSAIGLATDEPTTTYKVTISDDVDYTEFTEHYEEIYREGKIYTIKERK